MDLMTISPTTYRPVSLVEGYDSLIWTLRYQTYGDFELKTPYVIRTMNQMPLGSFVALNDGEEFMMVETHTTEEDDEGREILTVSGRSFTAFMENRIALDEYEFYNDFEDDPSNPGELIENGIHSWRLVSGGASWNDADAAANIITQHMITGVFKPWDKPGINPEGIPNLVVQQQDGLNRVANYSKFVERGNLYDAVVALIQSGGQGIRAVRPSSGSSNIAYVLYRGVDRSVDQSANTRVLLEQAQGHLTNVQTLRSIQNHRNTFRVYGTKRAYYENRVWGDNPNPPYDSIVTDPSRFGLNFRHQLVDATEINSLYFEQSDPALKARMALEKVRGQPVNTMSGKVSPTIPYRFGNEYYLGDVVSMLSNTGIRQSMRVTEYIRTEDERGEINYPGLSVL